MRVRSFACVLAVFAGACGPAAVDVGSTTSTTAEPAATTSTTSPAPATAEGELAAARVRWDAAGIDTYEFVLEDDCGECTPESKAPRTVVVWDGQALAGDRHDVRIEDLFGRIETALRAGRDVEVSYHPDLGFPTEIWIDREARAYDGGTHLLVHAVTEGLPGSSVSLAELEHARQLWSETRPRSYEFRTDIICDCPSDTTAWTLVDGDRIADWTIEWMREPGALDPAPITIDQLFTDLHELMAAGELVEAGARISGSAAYHPELGYPTWIGLDIEVVDPDSELGALPPRLVFVVRDLSAHDVESTEHARAVARWFEIGPEDYIYELTVHDVVEGSFGAVHHVTVESGQVTSVTANGVDVDPATVPAQSIPDLFAQIEAWQRDGWDTDVIYDARLGHPVAVFAASGEDNIAFSIAGLLPQRSDQDGSR